VNKPAKFDNAAVLFRIFANNIVHLRDQIKWYRRVGTGTTCSHFVVVQWMFSGCDLGLKMAGLDEKDFLDQKDFLFAIL
jgi:hypothetical protein